MYNSISQGQVATSLKIRSTGKIHNARWITLANNVLRLYAGLENPTKEIVILTKYITNVYAPVYFLNKFNSSKSDGVRTFFQIIKTSQFLEKKYKIIVDNSIHNSHFAHSENIIISMLSDTNLEIRRKGIQYIIEQ